MVGQERAEKNAQNRKLIVETHTAGRKSFAQIGEEIVCPIFQRCFHFLCVYEMPLLCFHALCSFNIMTILWNYFDRKQKRKLNLKN